MIKGVGKLNTSPVETTGNIIKGTGRFLSNVGSSLFSGDPDQDNVMKVALGYDLAKRQFAYKLGIDPYTDYAPVEERLGKISRVAVACGIAPKAALRDIDHDIALTAECIQYRKRITFQFTVNTTKSFSINRIFIMAII